METINSIMIMIIDIIMVSKRLYLFMFLMYDICLFFNNKLKHLLPLEMNSIAYNALLTSRINQYLTTRR